MLHPCRRRRSIYVEHKSNLWDAIADGELIEAVDHPSIQFACSSLINSRGIEESIGDHAHATFERRLDYLAHELAATSLKKEQLGLGRHAGVVRGKLQKLAYRLADRGAARFASQDVRNTASLKARREPFSLRGFSASSRSFERDERHPRHDVTCAHSFRFSSSKSVRISEALRDSDPA